MTNTRRFLVSGKYKTFKLHDVVSGHKAEMIKAKLSAMGHYVRLNYNTSGEYAQIWVRK